MSFNAFNFDPRLQVALQEAGYTQPTPIQQASLPLALAGRDLIGTAQTGTGKTAAFALPILQAMLDKPAVKGHTRALIVAPTRELADQIHQTFVKLGRHTGLRSATVYGGVGMQPQEKALSNGTEIIVACPGRLLDHVSQGFAKLGQVEFLVLDEADRMLDMGFLPDIRRIIALMPPVRQTMLFSATFAPELNRLVAHALRDPQRVDVGTEAPASTVAHALYPVPRHLKTALLLKLIESLGQGTMLVFTRTKHRANRLAERIQLQGHGAGILHSNKSQSQRLAALEGFRSGKHRLLVATDIAARGIDIASITHVINYDIPDSATTYIHRIGRTGRAERNGDAITLVTSEDAGLVHDIEKALHARIERKELEGFDYKAEMKEELSGRLSTPGGSSEFSRPDRPQGRGGRRGGSSSGRGGSSSGRGGSGSGRGGSSSGRSSGGQSRNQSSGGQGRPDANGETRRNSGSSSQAPAPQQPANKSRFVLRGPSGGA